MIGRFAAGMLHSSTDLSSTQKQEEDEIPSEVFSLMDHVTKNDPESKARREVALPVALALAQDHSTSTPSSFPVSPAPTAPTNNQPNLVLATVGDVIVTLSNNSDGKNVLSSLGYISSSIRAHCLCRLLSSPVMSYSLPPVPPPIPMRFLSSPAPLTVDPQFGSAANGWW